MSFFYVGSNVVSRTKEIDFFVGIKHLTISLELTHMYPSITQQVKDHPALCQPHLVSEPGQLVPHDVAIHMRPQQFEIDKSYAVVHLIPADRIMMRSKLMGVKVLAGVTLRCINLIEGPA